jgi:Zinc finger, C3HC4 type (RING finger)
MDKDLQLDEWSLDPDFTPNALLDLLGCKSCPDNPILQNPTTLACGHTVCSTHLGGDRRCPIQSCIPLDLSTKYPSISVVITGPSPGSMDPIGSDVRLTQIISLGLEHRLAHSSFAKELLQLLTCEICLNLLEEPITTPCQHTFCLTCIQRSLDHSPNCPLCRHHFSDISIFNLYRPNAILSSICESTRYMYAAEPPDLSYSIVDHFYKSTGHTNSGPRPCPRYTYLRLPVVFP